MNFKLKKFDDSIYQLTFIILLTLILKFQIDSLGFLYFAMFIYIIIFLVENFDQKNLLSLSIDFYENIRRLF